MSDEILQAILELKSDMGGIKADTITIKESLPSLFQRVNSVEKTQSRIKGYGAGILAAGSAVAGFLKLHHS